LAGIGGQSGYIDGAGDKSVFNYPSGIAVYIKENMLLVADHGNNRIRKITTAGEVSVLAGSGDPKSEDGEGTEASFNGPIGIAVDQRNGDVYVADLSGHKIRKITQQGRVSTVAGNGNRGMADGVGGHVMLHHPRGLCFSEKGECLYIADSSNHRIRKLDIKTGAVSTIAGTGEQGFLDGAGTVARFNYPSGIILIESDGSLLVADPPNHRIRCIKQQGAQFSVETLAGAGVQGSEDGAALQSKFYNPQSLCIDHGKNECYIADSFNHRIRKLSLW